MKITLYLMTQKGYEVLKSLVSNNLDDCISKVIVGTDKGIDNDFSSEIIDLCKQNNIKYFDRNDRYVIETPYSISISWRWLINNEKSQLIILHDSLLPKYRGFAPLVNALINQETEVGVTAIFASDEYDTGDIIVQSKRTVKYPIKIGEAIELISQNYIDLVLEIVTMINQNSSIKAVKQDEGQASFSLWRDEEDYLIDWNKSSHEILNFINAVSSPYKGASTYINRDQKIRIIDAEIVEDVRIENRNAGKVIFIHDEHPVIVCGKGLLKILKGFDDETGESILPFKKFRIRLSND